MQDGVFHDNTLLTLDLASPYFKSGRKDERFKVVVMEHKEDGHIRSGHACGMVTVCLQG